MSFSQAWNNALSAELSSGASKVAECDGARAAQGVLRSTILQRLREAAEKRSAHAFGKTLQRDRYLRADFAIEIRLIEQADQLCACRRCVELQLTESEHTSAGHFP